MNLSEMFRSKVVTVRPDDTVLAAAKKMKSENVGAAVVLQQDKIAGIVTDRDIVVRQVAAGLPPDTPVSTIMTREVRTVWNDQGVFNATQALRGYKVRRMPIIDRQDQLMGMVTADDLFGILTRELLNVAQALEPAIGARV